ncbi:MAG: type II toxin-antitoxin system prevent-host-death family antitoxin [Candidatus Berkelbacteria bacterium]
MKSINVNELQNKISQVMREVEAGEVYQVSRYSKPLAYLVPQGEYEAAVSGEGCKSCMQDLRKIAKKMEK